MTGETQAAPPPAPLGTSTGSGLQQQTIIEVTDTPVRQPTATPEPKLTGELELEQPGSQTPSDAMQREKDQMAALSSQGYPTISPAQEMKKSRDKFRHLTKTKEPGELPHGDTDEELLAPTERADSPPPSVFPQVTPLPPAPIEGTATPIADHMQASTSGSITDLTQTPPTGVKKKAPTFHELTPTQGMNGARRPPPTPIHMTPIRRTGSQPPPSPPETSQDQQSFRELALQRRARSSAPRRVRIAIDNTGGRIDPEDQRQIVPFDRGDSGTDSKNY